jgi:hypothetical protein
LRTSAACGASPYFFRLDFCQTEGGLAYQFTHAERPDPVPWANSVAQSTLIAVFEGFTAISPDSIHDLFEIGYIFHLILF